MSVEKLLGKLLKEDVETDEVVEVAEKDEEVGEPDVDPYDAINEDIKKIADYIISEVKQLAVNANDKKDMDLYKEEVTEILEKLEELKEITEGEKEEPKEEPAKEDNE